MGVQVLRRLENRFARWRHVWGRRIEVLVHVVSNEEMLVLDHDGHSLYERNHYLERRWCARLKWGFDDDSVMVPYY